MQKQHRKRKQKKRRPRNWPPSVRWINPGALAQFRSKVQPFRGNVWVVDDGIHTWKSPQYYKLRYNKKIWARDVWGTLSPVGRINDRYKIYDELCMIVDKRRLADNVVLVQIVYNDKVFWVESRQICKLKRKNNVLETVS